MGWIYRITHIDSDKSYVGQTVDLEKRWKEHCLAANNPDRYSGKSLHYAMRKYGLEKFRIDVVEQCDDSQLNDREKFWIKEFRTNVVDGGVGFNLNEGGVCSSLWKDKISKAQRGEKSAWFGKKHSDATKEKIRAAHLGRKFTKEHCENISKGKRGQIRHQTPAEREKRRVSLQSYMHAVSQYDKEGVLINEFQSIKRAIDWLRLHGFEKADASKIRGCTKGNRKSAYGYVWKDS